MTEQAIAYLTIVEPAICGALHPEPGLRLMIAPCAEIGPHEPCVYLSRAPRAWHYAANLAFGQHLNGCRTCRDAVSGPGCDEGEAMVEQALRAGTAVHESERGWGR